MAGQSSSFSSYGEHKKKNKCNYYNTPCHNIAECKKRIAFEKKKKEAGLVVSDASGNDATNDHANFSRDQTWGFLVQCHYNPNVHDAHDAYMLVSSSTWFFESGVSKQITSCRTLFTSHVNAPKGDSLTCANNTWTMVIPSHTPIGLSWHHYMHLLIF